MGAGEGWEYEVTDSSDETITVGSGKRLVGRTLPFGWGPGSYENQQIGPEQFIWYGNDSVIYAKNVIDSNGQYTYSKGTFLDCSGNDFANVLPRRPFWNIFDLYYQSDDSKDDHTRAFVSWWS